MAERHLHDHDSGEGLVPVENARNHVLGSIHPLQPLQLALTEATGCVLAEDVHAPNDMPPFPSSAMDGFAVRAGDLAGASTADPSELKVVGESRIGSRPEGTVGAGEAFRIATGAPVPAGADTVVAVENTEPDGDLVRIFEAPAAGRHVRPAGEDVPAGALLVPRGKRLGAPELGLLANAGIAKPVVHPRPRVVVLSTGDELIPPTETPAYGQVHDSNAYTIFAALREAGAIPVMAGIVRDDVDAFRDVVDAHTIQADAFISSGGVSVGERDVVKAAFAKRGEVAFYKVAMQPGMPQAFGQVDGKPYWGLPGNPVSVFVSLELFVRPALLKMMGRTRLDRPQVTATLTDGIRGPRGKMTYARVSVARGEDGGWTATPTGGRGSNLISTLARANGLAMIPPGTEALETGAAARVIVFRSGED